VSIVLYVLLGTACYYLGSRAEITEPLWQRAPERLYRFLVCPACSGFWYTAAWAAIFGYAYRWPLLGLAGNSVIAIPIAGLLGLVLVPLMAWLHIRAMETLVPGRH
jgi:hypothetical protein